MGENEIGYKRMVNDREAVSYLKALVQRFQDGRIVVAHGEKALDLEPPSVVLLEIEAKQKRVFSVVRGAHYYFDSFFFYFPCVDLPGSDPCRSGGSGRWSPLQTPPRRDSGCRSR